MRRPALLAAGAGAGLVLTLGGLTVSQSASRQAPAAAPGIVTPAAPPAAAGTTATSHPGTGTGTGTGAPTGSGGATAPLVINGPAASTRYGTVQVQITVAHHRIASVRALTLPSGGHSSEVSAFAGPALTQETLAAQKAGVDTVSGASYTSDGWRTSLQGALDTARAHGA
jgi:hypothetical protein